MYNLIDRAVTLSDVMFHSENLKHVKEILRINDYPCWFIDKYTKKRLNKIRFHTKDTSNKDLYVKLPKLLIPFNNISFNSLTNIFKSYNICVIPMVKKNLSPIIKLGKDTPKKWDCTNVVYKFNCKDCPATYVEATKRSFSVRINEHKKSKNKDSVVSIHQLENKHDFDWENTLILDFENNYQKRLISEMIHIKRNKNSIKKEDIQKLSITYFPVINQLNSLDICL